MSVPRLIPSAGIGLRAQHHQDVIEKSPDVGWFEAHTENYIADGGSHVEDLLRIRENYPVALHGVGLSLGSIDPLRHDHIAKVRRAIERFQPHLISEHLSWSSAGGRFANDLLPLPYTTEAHQLIVSRIAEAQDLLGRCILIENVSSYLQWKCSEIPEWEFINSVSKESGCGILLDLNNIFVSAFNHGFDPEEYLLAIDPHRVQEIHLAGHSVVEVDGRIVAIDTHGSPVCDEVWHLFRLAKRRFGEVPVLIEWDTDIPALEDLVCEAKKVKTVRCEVPRNAA